jgi:hypothetical protein
MKTPEDRRRENAEREVPRRDGGGQMGGQKASGEGGTGEPEESQTKNDTGRDRKADMPEDDGGRVPNR